MTYLDTHTAIFLCEGNLRSLSSKGIAQLDRENDIRLSPMVLLEMELLHEIGRIKWQPDRIVAALETDLGAYVCRRSFPDVVRQAATERWTRDPFDRLIVAQARLSDAALITLDALIQENYKRALG